MAAGGGVGKRGGGGRDENGSPDDSLNHPATRDARRGKVARSLLLDETVAQGFGDGLGLGVNL